MADSKTGKDLAVPLKIDGVTRYIKGATKYTTFGDVIKMVLKKTGISKEYRHLFSIVEETKDGDEPMYNKDRLLKIIKARPEETVIFVLKKTDTVEQSPTSERSAVDKQTQTKMKKKKSKTKHKVTHVESSDVRVKKDTLTAHRKTQIKACIKYSGGDELLKKRQEAEQGEAFTTRCDTSTSESEEELEEIISNLDQSKLSAFIKIFNSLVATDSKKCSKMPDTQLSGNNSSIRTQIQPRQYTKRRTDRHCSKKDRLSTSTHPNNSYAIGSRYVRGEEPNVSCPLDIQYPFRSERATEHEAKQNDKKHAPRKLLVKRCFRKKRSFDVGASEKKKTSKQREFTNVSHVSGAEITPIVYEKHVNRLSTNSHRQAASVERYTKFKVNRGFGATFVVQDDANLNAAFTASPCFSQKLVDYSLSEDEHSDNNVPVSTFTDQPSVQRQEDTRSFYTGCPDRMGNPNVDFIKSNERSNSVCLDTTNRSHIDCCKRTEQQSIASHLSLEKAHVGMIETVEKANNEWTYVKETSQSGWTEGNLSNDSSGLETGDDSGEYASVLDENCSNADVEESCVDTTADLIMTVFSKQCSLGEDEEMDSFMLSKTYDEDEDLLDEGIICCSGESDQSDCV